MEKRFFVFMMLAGLIMSCYVGLQLVFGPGPEPPVAEGQNPDLPGDDPKAGDPKAGDPTAQDPAAGAPDRKDPKDPAVGEPEPPVPDPNGPSVEPGVEAPQTASPAAVPTQWHSLGSYDPATGSRLLVTLSNRGGAPVFIELTERTAKGKLRYRDLEARSGYLGHLALTDTDEGPKVGVVGHGTPAYVAGLAVGDVITALDGEEIASFHDFAQRLEKTRRDQSLRITVLRAGKSQDLKAILGAHPLAMIAPEDDPTGINHASPLLVSLARIDKLQNDEEHPWLEASRTENWTVSKANAEVVEFRYRVHGPTEDASSGVELVRRFQLPPVPTEERGVEDTTAYHLNMDLEVHNLGMETRTVAYEMDGPNGLPKEGWWYSYKVHPAVMSSAGARDVVWGVKGGVQLRGCTNIWKQAKDPVTPTETIFGKQPEPLDFVGVDTQYFASVIRPRLDSEDALMFANVQTMALGDVTTLPKAAARSANTSFRMTSVPEKLEPGQSISNQFTLFVGPKRQPLLSQYDLDQVIIYGWFSFISQPLSFVLHFFYQLIGNYGVAIILLTVLVRSCMFPISRKAAKNAQMMQELAPEMKKITEKYKTDMEKRAAAQRELFAKHNYNPFGGCLLMFLQLPIFLGLYRCLSVDIELRQASLIPGIQWCSNLAGPDMLFRWDQWLPEMLAGTTGWLGPYCNVLPLVTVVLFLVQQQLFTPPPTDEQQVMQQKMMKFMMLFMGVLFFKVASGLCLYFIASSLWGIAERKLLPRSSVAKLADKDGGGGGGKKKAADSGEKPKTGFAGLLSGGNGDSNGNGSGKGGNKNRNRKRNKKR